MNTEKSTSMQGHPMLSGLSPERAKKGKIVTAEEAVRVIRNGDTLVNYDNFTIAPEVIDTYTDMVKNLIDRFYSGATRYTTSTFLRMKIGDALQGRDVSPYIYESQEETRDVLRRLR